MNNQIFKLFEANANPEQAQKMSAYMRDQFTYFGIPTPKRKELSKEFLSAAKKENVIDWDFVRDCWARPERELQYFAVNYMSALKELLTPADIPALKEFATTKSWWDTVDGLDMLVGHIAFKFPEVNETLLEWSVDENIWLRRIAIDHQLPRKEKTDTTILEEIIKNNFGQQEFFVNKAIGWSLREYAKTNPTWVRDFLERYKDKLAPLSIREAGKHL